MQDAFAVATATWHRTGVPERPGAWLWTVASRRAVDILRRTSTKEVLDLEALAASLPEVHVDEPTVPGDPLSINDDLLGLILACAHPAISAEGRIALTLRHVVGFHPREIAAAFLIAEAAMEKRLVRARAKLRASGVSLAIPPAERLQERLDDARTVISLLFTEGHLTSCEGPPVRATLCDEAIWLARALHDLAPHDPENAGLLASLLFHHARADARLDEQGRLVPFDRQDRSRWNRAAITEARALLGETAAFHPGPYCIAAAIAALHAACESGDVAWQRIAELYAILRDAAPSDVVDLNFAYAVGRARGARQGLNALAAVAAEGRLERYAPFHAARADLFERANDAASAASSWQSAAACAPRGRRRDAYLDRLKPDDIPVATGHLDNAEGRRARR